MHWIPLTRYVALGIPLLFSLVILALAAHSLTISRTGVLQSTFDFQGMAIATSVFSFIFLPALLLADKIRPGSWMTMVVTELSCLGLLCLFWIVSAGLSSKFLSTFFPGGCNNLFLTGEGESFCQESTAIQGLSFVNWIFLLIYTLSLLVLSVITKSRGHHVFKTAVTEALFFSRPGEASKGVQMQSYTSGQV